MSDPRPDIAAQHQDENFQAQTDISDYPAATQKHDPETLETSDSDTDSLSASISLFHFQPAVCYFVMVSPNSPSVDASKAWWGQVIFGPTSTFCSTTRAPRRVWTPAQDSLCKIPDSQVAAEGPSHAGNRHVEMHERPDTAAATNEKPTITFRGPMWVPSEQPQEQTAFTPDWADPSTWKIREIQYLGVAGNYPSGCFSADPIEVSFEKQVWYSELKRRKTVKMIYDCAHDQSVTTHQMINVFPRDAEAFLKTKSGGSRDTYKLRVKAGSRWVGINEKASLSGEFALLDNGGSGEARSVEALFDAASEIHFYPLPNDHGTTEEKASQQLEFQALKDVPTTEITRIFCDGRYHKWSENELDYIKQRLQYIQDLDAKRPDGEYIDPDSSPDCLFQKWQSTILRVTRIKEGDEVGTVEDISKLTREGDLLGKMYSAIVMERQELADMRDGKCD